MSKQISAGLTTALASTVVTIATCVAFTRIDGRRVFLTNHDASLTVAGDLYRHDIPFSMSAIATGSTLSSDNCSIEVGLDGTTFLAEDFRNGLWRNAQVEIFHVNYTDTSQGKLTLRRGIVRQTTMRKVGNVTFDIDGLLKVLDFKIGRVYTPVCSADFGDKKCKFAVDYSQHRSFLNPYYLADWVFWYDESQMTSIPVTNHDFEDDGNRTSAQAITGWTKSESASWAVAATGTNFVTTRTTGRQLAGATDADAAPEDQYLYQDLSLSGISTPVDAGEIVFALFVEVAQAANLADYQKIRVDILDANSTVIQSQSTGWYQLDEADAWRERSVIFHVLPTGRTARVYLEGRRKSGSVCNVNFTNVRAFYWNINLDDPTQGLVFKVTNLLGQGSTRGANNWLYPANPSFQYDGAIADTTPPGSITGWTVDSGIFDVKASEGGVSANGTYGLWSDAASASNVISQIIDVEDYISAADALFIDSNGAVLNTQTVYMFPNTSCRIQLIVYFQEADGTPISSKTFTNHNRASAGGATKNTVKQNTPMPALTRKIKFEYTFTPGGGSNVGGIDDVQFQFAIQALKPKMNPVVALLPRYGEEDTVPDYTLGGITADGDVVWSAHITRVYTDIVSSVIDNKEFEGTFIFGTTGDFETTKIRWLNGANAGRENIIRTWNNANARIKLFYPEPNPIQIGDLFYYVHSCQKRFETDCSIKFSNWENFRGFPKVPGIIDG